MTSDQSCSRWESTTKSWDESFMLSAVMLYVLFFVQKRSKKTVNPAFFFHSRTFIIYFIFDRAEEQVNIRVRNDGSTKHPTTRRLYYRVVHRIAVRRRC